MPLPPFFEWRGHKNLHYSILPHPTTHLTSPHLSTPHYTTPYLSSPCPASPQLASPDLTSPHLILPHLTTLHTTLYHTTPNQTTPHLLAKLHDMYLYKTDSFFHINRYLKLVLKVAVLHRFHCYNAMHMCFIQHQLCCCLALFCADFCNS